MGNPVEQVLMQKLVIGMSTSRGFTLIEILIVLLILGVTLGFALLAFGDFGESRRLFFSVEQLANALRVAQQQAILETSTFGLKVDPTHYQIVRLSNASQWQVLPNKKIFAPHTFPKNTRVVLTTQHPSSPGDPSIILYPSGEMSAFTLHFGINKQKMTLSLIGKPNGDLHVSPLTP